MELVLQERINEFAFEFIGTLEHITSWVEKLDDYGDISHEYKEGLLNSGVISGEYADEYIEMVDIITDEVQNLHEYLNALKVLAWDNFNSDELKYLMAYCKHTYNETIYL